MKRKTIICCAILAIVPLGCTDISQSTDALAVPSPAIPGGDGWNSLTPEESAVIEQCGTERPFSGKFVNHKANGTYTCRKCGAPLFSSDTKFDSGSGWPAFDGTLTNSVRELPDPDGRRTEIRCARCDGHLGHVFRGERMTRQNTRHCVNSVSMDFVSKSLEEAYFAGGCFWGVEYLLEKMDGVHDVVSGYMGGTVSNPAYRAVITGKTGHAEAVRVYYDPSKISYRQLAKMFFEIHDPTQVDRQGPDIGNQYRSAVFVTTPKQRTIVEELIQTLKKKGLKVVTTIHSAQAFWPAERYHQDYYVRTGKEPYCHGYVKRF